MSEVSVIVPIYNAQAYLTETLSALAGQSFSSVEFILIDDGSSDNSPHIIDEWAQRDSRFRCVHISNGGVYNARKRGIQEARGKYVAFCDSDDIPLPNMIEKNVYPCGENRGRYGGLRVCSGGNEERKNTLQRDDVFW